MSEPTNPLDALPEPEAILRRLEEIEREKKQLKALYPISLARREQAAAQKTAEAKP